MTDTDKLSAMEAAARAMSKALDRDNDRFDNPRNYERESYMREATACVVAYLQALAEDEGTVEVCAQAIDAEVKLRQGKFRSPIDEARAALSTLLQRAGDRG